MIVKIMRILAASAMMLLLADVRPATCEGWSILHPFSSSESKQETKTRQPAPKTARQESSTLDKMGQGTKKFFSQTGETLGLKKPEPKKPTYATAKPPVIQPPPKKESKSWFGSMFQPEEKKPKTVGEWMSQNKRMDP